MLQSASRIPAAHPIKFGVAISAIKTSAADFVAQRVVEGRLDQFIHHPFMLFPCFYLVKETIEKPDAGAAAIWSEGRRKQLQNVREDCIVCWTTWIPAFLVNFSVMPMWGRVPFVAAVSFGFTTYFSFLRGGPSDDAG